MKILLDADASIKLTKIGFMEILSSGFDVILTDVVYDEHVNVGLKRGYPDAKEMERSISEKKVLVVQVKKEALIFHGLNLGRGEISIITYCQENHVDVVVSDDVAFLKVLKSMKSVPFIPVSVTLIPGIEHGLIDKDEALEFLELLKDMIKADHYLYVKSEIEGLK
ncbi:hypothetical protein [Methanolobus sp. WCC5]|uniref:hypothetical protein n=1 Tax=Methanolobus sp. WCC5 TaxID=3125785 RepID=UPI0032475959